MELGVSYLIHKSKDSLLIGFKAPSKFAPERSELGCTSCFWICSITDDASSCWLLGRIVVSHIIVGIQDTVRSLGDSDIVHRCGKLRVVLNIIQFLPILRRD